MSIRRFLPSVPRDNSAGIMQFTTVGSANAVTTATDAVGESVLPAENSGLGSPSLYTEKGLGGEVLNSLTASATFATF